MNYLFDHMTMTYTFSQPMLGCQEPSLNSTEVSCLCFIRKVQKSLHEEKTNKKHTSAKSLFWETKQVNRTT